jgi:hypothetical protein
MRHALQQRPLSSLSAPPGTCRPRTVRDVLAPGGNSSPLPALAKRAAPRPSVHRRGFGGVTGDEGANRGEHRHILGTGRSRGATVRDGLVEAHGLHVPQSLGRMLAGHCGSREFFIESSRASHAEWVNIPRPFSPVTDTSEQGRWEASTPAACFMRRVRRLTPAAGSQFSLPRVRFALVSRSLPQRLRAARPWAAGATAA